MTLQKLNSNLKQELSKKIKSGHLQKCFFIFLITAIFFGYSLDYVFAVELTGSIRDLLNEEKSQEFTKIDPRIIDNFKNPTAVQFSTNVDGYISDDLISVYIYLDSKDSISSLDQTMIKGQDDNIVVATLSLDQIQSLSNLDMVKKITMPQLLQTHSHDISEGVAITKADEMHTAGFTGSGVTIAIIDVNFLITNSEIDQGHIISTHLFDATNACAGLMACGATSSNSHGTAVAEIVVDMAPEADMRLYTVVTTVDFNNAVDDAIAKNVDIITASLGANSLAPDGDDDGNGGGSTNSGNVIF